ncbi:MAG: succinate:quinone oxidoreductase [Pyrodictiaceae archaeon]
MVRASSINIWQYITAIILIFVLSFHLIERVPGLSPLGATGYEESVEYEKVKTAYESYGWVLGLLLIVALFHGFNGLRGILLEWRQGRGWSIFANALFWILFLGFTAYGLATIIGHLAG